MSEQLEPRPYSERELTLKAISVTFLRASAAQQRLTGGPTLAAELDADADTTADIDAQASVDPDPEPADAGFTDPRFAESDPQPDSAAVDPLDAEDPGAIEQTIRQDEEQEQQALPNPIVTDTNLRHYLDLATSRQGNPDRVATSRLWRRLFGDRHPDQLSYNGAIVHALHQLDHRTRLQQRTITQLEAELAETRRALAAFQSDGMRSS